MDAEAPQLETHDVRLRYASLRIQNGSRLSVVLSNVVTRLVALRIKIRKDLACFGVKDDKSYRARTRLLRHDYRVWA